MMDGFIIFFIPIILILLYIFFGFFVKLFIEYKKGLMYKNNIFKSFNISDAKMDTIKNSLDKVKNYHRIKKISDDMLLFMNEYSISLIMVKDYSGQIIGNKNDVKLLLKSGSIDKMISNPKIEFNKKEMEISKYLNGYKYNNYLIVGGICITDINFDNIDIIRMDDYYYCINKIEIKRKYTKEQINNLFDSLK